MDDDGLSTSSAGGGGGLGLHPPQDDLSASSSEPSSSSEKPAQSYIGLIAMAILSSPQRKMILSEVYDWITTHYAYFRSRGSGWRNSIRHNLSLNDCFVKAGRAANGKGHYWAIHPANMRDFERGDFRRRRAQRKVRRHMGLSVDGVDSSDNDDDDGGETRSDPRDVAPVLLLPNLLNYHAAAAAAATAAAAAAAAAATTTDPNLMVLQLLQACLASSQGAPPTQPFIQTGSRENPDQDDKRKSSPAFSISALLQ